LPQVEEHEHSGGEGMVQAREILEEIVAHINQLVDPTAIAANNICSHTVQLLALGQLHGVANHRGMRQLDIGVEEENISTVGLGRTQIPADGRHPTPDEAYVQPVGEAENNFASAIGRIGVSY
jgi:hypothetical protein